MENNKNYAFVVNECTKKAKKILNQKISELPADINFKETVCKKLQDIPVITMSYDEMKRRVTAADLTANVSAFYWLDENGKPTIVIPEVDSFKEKNVLHALVHEFLHHISGGQHKDGFAEYFKYKSTGTVVEVGRAFDEGATELFTSLLLDDNYIGYSREFKYLTQIIMTILKMTEDDLMIQYLQDEKCLLDNSRKYNSKDSYLLFNTFIQWDKRLKKNEGICDVDYVYSGIVDTINLRLAEKDDLDYMRIYSLLKELEDKYKPDRIDDINGVGVKLNSFEFKEVSSETTYKYEELMKTLRNMLLIEEDEPKESIEQASDLNRQDPVVFFH